MTAALRCPLAVPLRLTMAVQDSGFCRLDDVRNIRYQNLGLVPLPRVRPDLAHAVVANIGRGKSKLAIGSFEKRALLVAATAMQHCLLHHGQPCGRCRTTLALSGQQRPLVLLISSSSTFTGSAAGSWRRAQAFTKAASTLSARSRTAAVIPSAGPASMTSKSCRSPCTSSCLLLLKPEANRLLKSFPSTDSSKIQGIKHEGKFS